MSDNLGLDLLIPEQVAIEHGEHSENSENSGQGVSEKYKVVSIRLRSAEFESFCDQAKALDLSSNLALRIAARRIAGFLEIDHGTRHQLEGIVATIGDISRDIRRLHADYAGSGKVDTSELEMQRTAFGEEFARLDALLRSILNVSQRRLDGRQKLAEAKKHSGTAT